MSTENGVVFIFFRAKRDHRLTALDHFHLLKKVDENFYMNECKQLFTHFCNGSCEQREYILKVSLKPFPKACEVEGE